MKTIGIKLLQSVFSELFLSINRKYRISAGSTDFLKDPKSNVVGSESFKEFIALSHTHLLLSRSQLILVEFNIILLLSVITPFG